MLLISQLENGFVVFLYYLLALCVCVCMQAIAHMWRSEGITVQSPSPSHYPWVQVEIRSPDFLNKRLYLEQFCLSIFIILKQSNQEWKVDLTLVLYTVYILLYTQQKSGKVMTESLLFGENPASILSL